MNQSVYSVVSQMICLGLLAFLINLLVVNVVKILVRINCDVVSHPTQMKTQLLVCGMNTVGELNALFLQCTLCCDLQLTGLLHVNIYRYDTGYKCCPVLDPGQKS